MSDKSDYPKRSSDVEVVFNDGSIETYRLGVGSGFGLPMAKQAGEHNVLTLLCGSKVHCFPLASIRSWSLTELPAENEDGKS